jgi:undecaprenyl-diphosphatase
MKRSDDRHQLNRPYNCWMVSAPILLSALFVLLSIAVDRNLLVSVDESAGFWVHRHMTPARTALMFVWTDLAAAWFVAPFTFIIGCFLGFRGAGYWVERLAWTVPGCMLSIEIVKHVFQRDRPIVPHPLLDLATFSFPSGHAASAMVFYSFLAIMICSQLKNRIWHAIAWSVAAVIIAGVGFSRMYLGVHYVTDVAGGFLMGLIWLSLAPLLVKTGRREL